jgi:hypothetical protein
MESANMYSSVDRTFEHIETSWHHVLSGQSTGCEKMEATAETVATALIAAALVRFVPGAGKIFELADGLSTEGIVPELELSATKSMAPEFIQKSFVDAETQAQIPASQAELFGKPVSRLGESTVPVGDFAPNETEWRQMMSSERWTRDYGRKVRRNESPSLSEAAPDRVKALSQLTAGREATRGERTVWMTARGMESYRERLQIPDHELDTPGRLVLDLGAGAQQELAKDARLAGLRSIVASVDPSLGKSVADDLASLAPHAGKFRPGADHWFLTPGEYRYLGRLNPERFTATDESELPFKQYDSVYAQYSIPYYTAPDELEGAMARINGLLAPRGNARVYPIRPCQIAPIRGWFAKQNIEPTFEHVPEKTRGMRLLDDPDLGQFHLLTWQRS